MQEKRDDCVSNSFSSFEYAKSARNRNSCGRVSGFKQPGCNGDLFDPSVGRNNRKNIGQIGKDVFSSRTVPRVNNPGEKTEVQGPDVVFMGQKKEEFTNRNSTVEIYGNHKEIYCQANEQKEFQDKAIAKVGNSHKGTKCGAQNDRKYNFASVAEINRFKRYTKRVFCDINWKCFLYNFVLGTAASFFLIWLCRSDFLHGYNVLIFPFLWLSVAIVIQNLLNVIYQPAARILGRMPDYDIARILCVYIPFLWPVILVFLDRSYIVIDGSLGLGIFYVSSFIPFIYLHISESFDYSLW